MNSIVFLRSCLAAFGFACAAAAILATIGAASWLTMRRGPRGSISFQSGDGLIVPALAENDYLPICYIDGIVVPDQIVYRSGENTVSRAIRDPFRTPGAAQGALVGLGVAVATRAVSATTLERRQQ